VVSSSKSMFKSISAYWSELFQSRWFTGSWFGHGQRRRPAMALVAFGERAVAGRF